MGCPLWWEVKGQPASCNNGYVSTWHQEM
jgi:hypothetical protein